MMIYSLFAFCDIQIFTVHQLSIATEKGRRRCICFCRRFWSPKAGDDDE